MQVVEISAYPSLGKKNQKVVKNVVCEKPVLIIEKEVSTNDSTSCDTNSEATLSESSKCQSHLKLH
jgi:hypothetical protein